jgi:hypothetical protein
VKYYLLRTMQGTIETSLDSRKESKNMLNSRGLTTYSTVKEEYRLKSKQDGWNLAGGILTTSTTRTTRQNAGSSRAGRPKKPPDETSSDSDYDDIADFLDISEQDDHDLDEDEWEDEEENSSEDDDDDDDEEEEGDDDGGENKPAATRLILEFESLKKVMETNCRCPECKGPVTMAVNTICLASNVMLCCNDEDCGYVDHSDPPASTKIGQAEDNDRRERSTDYAVNVLYVLGFLSSGDGCSEAARILGLLGLPNDTTMQSRSFSIVEERISRIIQSVTSRILLDNLIEEVRLTFAAIPNKDPNDFELWRRSLYDSNAVLPLDKYPKVDASFDMAWQQRSSGRRYASVSGHAFFVGALSRRPIAMDIKCKICNYCSTWLKSNKNNDVAEAPVPMHDCTKNHVGASKAMEPLSALTLVVDTYDRCHVIVARICIDDDASTRAKLKWSNADYMKNNNTNSKPQVPKTQGANKGEMQDRPDAGKLPGHIPEPAFVADPNHRKKVWTNVLYGMMTKSVEARCHLTTLDITRLTKNFGYMIKSLKRMSDEGKYLAAATAVLDHHFDEHKDCGAWCRRKTLNSEQRKATKRFYRSMEHDAKLYKLLQSLLARFITLDKLQEVAHPMDTQVNESMNNTISWLAPKNKCYAGSQSLKNRISIAVGINALGLHKYFKRLFHALGITMTRNITHFLSQKDRKRAKRIAKSKTTAQKRLRNKNIFDKLKREEAATLKSRQQKDGTYKSGMHILGDSEEDDDPVGNNRPEKRPRKNPKNETCPTCGKKGHTTTRSKHCLHYTDKNKTQRTAAEAAGPPQEEQDTESADAAEDIDAYEALQLLLHEAAQPRSGVAVGTNSPDSAQDREVQVLNII